MPASVLKYVPANPNPAGFIRDVPGALSGADRRALNERITTIRGRIHGDIGVAILADIGDIAPYELGTAIYRSWKIGTVAPIGNARRDVGALVLLVPKELAPNHQGQCWITTGRGSEGAVIDAAAGAVCRERVIPAMKARDYAAAVDSAISGIEHLYLVGLDSLTAAQARELARVTETRALSQRGRSGAQGTSWRERLGPVAILAVFLGLAGVIIGIVWGIGRYLRFRSRPCPRGHGRMQLLSESEDDLELEEGARFEERIGSVNYDVWRCPAPGCTERVVIRRSSWRSGYADCGHCHRRALTSCTVTLVSATQHSTGLEECTTTCAFCRTTHTTRHVTPVLPPPPPPSSSSSSGSSSGSSGSSFGGSGSTSGGGGGASY
ncbi:MAG: hypothetical protein JWN79_818 [Gemmatimonadetes bacterium]|nr:hypothetical protein [Gemmatimonadota bacterium]